MPDELLLPRDWKKSVCFSVLQVLALARVVMGHVRAAVANSPIELLRLRVALGQAMEEVALLREELRIKDARMAKVPAAKRPHYLPTDRMAILELKTARGWSSVETERRMQVTSMTLRSWLKRIDDGTLVKLPVPVNKFPEFVREIVRRLKLTCPALGSVKIAQILCRAALHIAPKTVERISKEKPAKAPSPVDEEPAQDKQRVVTAKRRNHVWHVDLTTVPMGGFWVPWFPFALPNCFPFCWWVAVVVDQYSRSVMGIEVFWSEPTSAKVQKFLADAIRRAGKPPKHLICDRGCQFDCHSFREWCRNKSRNIKWRYGKAHKHGSIAIVERVIKTLKYEGLRGRTIPYARDVFLADLHSWVRWYNGHRPHTSLQGRTPNEVYYYRTPANRKPRLEPRESWPMRSPCAAPSAKMRGKPGRKFELRIRFQDGCRNLPIVQLVAA